MTISQNSFMYTFKGNKSLTSFVKKEKETERFRKHIWSKCIGKWKTISVTGNKSLWETTVRGFQHVGGD